MKEKETQVYVIRPAKGVYNLDMFAPEELQGVEHLLADESFELVRATPGALRDALVDKPYLKAIPAPDGRYVDIGGAEIAILDGKCFDPTTLPPEVLAHLPTY